MQFHNWLVRKLGGAISEITSEITLEITSEIISEVIGEVISEVPLRTSFQTSLRRSSLKWSLKWSLKRSPKWSPKYIFWGWVMKLCGGYVTSQKIRYFGPRNSTCWLSYFGDDFRHEFGDQFRDDFTHQFRHDFFIASSWDLKWNSPIWECTTPGNIMLGIDH